MSRLSVVKMLLLHSVKCLMDMLTPVSSGSGSRQIELEPFVARAACLLLHRSIQVCIVYDGLTTLKRVYTELLNGLEPP